MKAGETKAENVKGPQGQISLKRYKDIKACETIQNLDRNTLLFLRVTENNLSGE